MNIKRYNSVAIIVHWIMAILLLCMFVLGIYMVDLPKGSDERSWFFALHKSMGLTLALLALFRLFWKFISESPPLPDDVTTTQKIAAVSTHNLLYLMMFVQPTSGYISSCFSGYKTKFWGIPLPHWGWKSPELNQLFTSIHDISAVIFGLLIILHISGAMFHIHKKQFHLFKRMWF
jgi:cytochrome b561|tara:strand:+ start:223 stop:750 length:528 start_codon:yes stop_codon:yes gene_type:complete